MNAAPPVNGDSNGFDQQRCSPSAFRLERNGSVSSDNGASDTPPSSSRKRTGSSSCSSATAEKRVATKVCRICGDKAFSYNFNVITCESCKAFFRRNALKEKEIRCPFNQNCDINVVSRRFCQYCRLTKCFNEGMKKEWIMSDEARLEKKKRVQDNRERRMAESKAREGARRQLANAAVESNGDHPNQENQNPPAQNQVQNQIQNPPKEDSAPAAVPMDTSPPAIVQSNPYYPPSAPAHSFPQVSSPAHRPIHLNPGTVTTLLPSSIIATVPAVPTAIPVASQIINETLSSVNVPDMTIPNPMTTPLGMAPLNAESHVQTLLAQAAVTPPTAPSLVSPELAAVQQAQVQLNELAQVAMAQQQQQLAVAAVQQQIAVVGGQTVPTVPSVAAPTATAVQQAQAQLNELAQVAIVQQHQQQAIEAAQIVAHAQQQQLAAAVAAATATATGMVSSPPQTLFQSNPAAVVLPSHSVVVPPSIVTHSQPITVPPSQPSSNVNSSATRNMIAVPRDLLQKLVQSYTSQPPPKNVGDRERESSPPPPSEAPVKCECKCKCGRYPAETLIVDQVMMDLLENSTKQCDETATWLDRTEDEMTSFEKEMMSCISDDARKEAETGGHTVEDEEDLDMSEYDQELLDEIEYAITKTHKFSAPDWVFTTGRNASDAEIIQEAIKATTIFCQEIEIFCKLSREDQMIIIKVGCLGFMILNAARSFNILTIGAAATNEIHDISIRLFKMFHSEWKSSDAIINVMCMLLLFDPDVSGIENVDGLDDEYDQYSLLMEKVMYQQNGNDRLRSHSEFNEVQALLRSVASSLSTQSELLERCGTDSAILAILDNR